MRQGGRMGMLGDLRCQPLYSHLARDEDGALGRAAVDNAHYRWQLGIGLQVGGAFESACRALSMRLEGKLDLGMHSAS